MWYYLLCWLFPLCLCSACASAATFVFFCSISVKHLPVLAGEGRRKTTKRQDSGACRLDSGACRAAPGLPVQAVLPAGRRENTTSKATSQGTLILRPADTHTHSKCEAVTHPHSQDWLALNDWGSHSLTHITARHSLSHSLTNPPVWPSTAVVLLYCQHGDTVTVLPDLSLAITTPSLHSSLPCTEQACVH